MLGVVRYAASLRYPGEGEQIVTYVAAEVRTELAGIREPTHAHDGARTVYFRRPVLIEHRQWVSLVKGYPPGSNHFVSSLSPGLDKSPGHGQCR